MKQISIPKQKWLLTASLIAVLASSYTFQSSSLQFGAIEMSSQEPGMLEKEPGWGQKEKSPLSSNDKKNNDTQKTQAQSADSEACTSGECKTTAAPSVLLKLEDYQKLVARIAELEKTKEMSSSDEKNDASKKEELKNETLSEKRERLAQEKKDKEKEKQIERIAKFEEKMEDVKDKCDMDVQCLATEFNNQLSKYEGKNSIPSGIVNKYFKSIVAGPLAKSLYNDGVDGQAALEVLQSIMSDAPSQYAGIKQITMDTVRSKATGPASKINQGYKNANELSKQNNPEGYLQQMNEVREEQITFRGHTYAYAAMIEQTLRESGDQSSLSYYQRSYLPNMQKIMNSLSNPTAIETATTNKVDENSSRNTRNGQGASTQNQSQNLDQRSERSSQNSAAKMTNPTPNTDNSSQQIQWQLSNPNGAVQHGQPTKSTRGGRGSY